MRNKFELIVFDWDGTLMDSEAKIVNCFAAACSDVGLAFPGAAACRDIIGLGMREALERLLPDANEEELQAMVGAYREHFLERDQTEMVFFPGVQDGLQRLLERGYLLAVATGKARRGLNRVLSAWHMEQHFVATRCADEAYSKPHPQMLLDILDATGMQATQALMVGDTVYDMEMAQNAAMPSLAVSYGVHQRERLQALGPLACVDSFDEVCAWLL